MTTGTQRACFVTQQYPPDRSGHATRIRDLAGGLADEEWEVEVLAPPPAFPHGEFDRDWTLHERDEDEGVVVHRVWAWQPTQPDPSTVSRLAYYVTFAFAALLWLCWYRTRYDAVVTTTPPISTGVAGFAPALTGTTWVVDVRDRWIDASVSLGFLEPGGLLERVSRRFQTTVLHRADRICTTTAALAETLTDQYDLDDAEPVMVVPTGVDTDRFDAESDPCETAEPPVIVYTGNIGHAQDLEACVRAMNDLSTDAELWLVGGGDLVPALQSLVAERDLEDRVRFVGSVPSGEIPDLLNEATIGLAPLVDDPELAYAMPTKVYEYLGCGLPVVTTGRGELRRFVEESGGGLHVDNDSEALAAAFERLLGNDQLRVDCARSGRAYVEQEYDRGAIAARFGRQLRTLVEGADMPSQTTPRTAVTDGSGGGDSSE